jgi:APA family basic amino acid/polyamine antiporter
MVAWIIGWDLILEYLFGIATVAWGWSGYLNSFLRNFGLYLPPQLSGTPWDDFVFYEGHWEQVNRIAETLQAHGISAASLPHHQHGVFNLFGALAVVLVSAIVVIGIKESANGNSVIVMANVFVLLFFVAVGGNFLLHNHQYIRDNWHPFIPTTLAHGRFGWSGILRGAAFLFFAYIGFDAVSTTAQEAKRPQRDLPIGILGTISICTVLYVLFAGILVGLVNYRGLDVSDPLAVGIKETGLHFGILLVTIGALAGLSSTLFVMLIGLSRVLYSMSKDGLLPKFFSAIHPRYRTPARSSILTGIFVALLAGLLPIDVMAEMVSIGTLLAFAVVSLGILVLRRTSPEIHRPFRVPGVPFVPLAAVAGCVILAASLTRLTWIRLAVWFTVGMGVYFSYGRRHSKVQLQLSLEGSDPDHPALFGVSDAPAKTPEAELVSQVFKGALVVLVIAVGLAAALGWLSIYRESVNRDFLKLTPIVGLIAIAAGLFSAVWPRVRAFWLLRTQPVSFDEEGDEPVRELIEKLRRSTDDPS